METVGGVESGPSAESPSSSPEGKEKPVAGKLVETWQQGVACPLAGSRLEARCLGQGRSCLS